MRRGLALSCFIGLIVVGVAKGRAPAPVAPVPDKAVLEEVRKLQEKRRDVLREALEAREKLYRAARATLGEVIDVSKRLLAVELELATTDAERVAAHERHYEKALGRVEVARARHAAARGSYAEVLDAQDACLEARIGLLKAGGKPKKAEK